MVRRETRTSSDSAFNLLRDDESSTLRARSIRTGAGFTIVELLIVIVVIAILAAITIIAYNGITNRAKETALQSDLQGGANQLGITKAETGSYPADASGLKKSDGTNFTYAAVGDSFCLSVSSPSLPGKSFFVTDGAAPSAGDCPWMQTFTPAKCSALSVYTGGNPSAIRSLTDSRGGTTRTYEVAKLADNKCWMLTNLKLGSTTGTIILTPTDSDVASNFTLPQMQTGGPTSYDAPTVVGPVPGDTGNGTTNYGYLYNWPAATAGESGSTMPAGSGNAANSICPAGWRLPTGGTTASDLGQLDIAFGGTGNAASDGETNIAKWQPDGPLRTVLAGYSSTYAGTSYLTDQGSATGLWSASASPSNAQRALSAYFGPGFVYPGMDLGRYFGYGVRCVQN